MAEDKKNPKEASNIFHSIMKASVSKPVLKKEKSFEATIKLVNGDIIRGTLTYLPNKHYDFKATNNPNIRFKFHGMVVLGTTTQLIVDGNTEGFRVYDSYMEQLEEQIAINDMPTDNSTL